MNEETTVDRSVEIEAMSPREMAESIRTFTRAALAELADRREKAYTAASADFAEELAILTREGDTLETESQGTAERLESASRIARFEADRLVLLGENVAAQAKLREPEEIKAELAKIEGRRVAIAQRCQEIETAKKTELRRGAESFRESSIALIRGTETALAGILDTTRDTLNILEMQTGASLYQPGQLTADEKTPEWITLNRLYRGRG